MLQEVLLHKRLQKAIWCGHGVCPTIPARWASLRDGVVSHADDPEVTGIVGDLARQQHNLFAYPQEERGLWLELEGDGLKSYGEKKRADVVYFVGCKTSFLSSFHQQAVNTLRRLAMEGTDVAVLGQREWCCGLPLKRLGLEDEFQRYREHNLLEVQRIGARQVIFGCLSCYHAWQEEYQSGGLEMIYRERSQEEFQDGL